MNKIPLIALVFLAACQPFSPAETELTQWVDPFIGTDGPGNTYPGATVPFGMVQLSPDNGRSGWDWIAGYFYPDTAIAGFSHLHLSGTGAGDLYDISFFSWLDEPKQASPGELGPSLTPYSRFTHDREKAKPGYYQVDLLDYEINAELTTTRRSGLQQYTFNKAGQAAIQLDLGYARNWDWPTQTQLEKRNDSTLSGYRLSSGWAKDQRVFFYSVYSKAFEETDFVDSTKAIVRYSVQSGDKVLVKTGISSVSVENAKANLEAEQTGFDFEKVRAEADQLWEEQLGKIRIKTDPDNMKQFYTAMYHSMLGPTLFSDVNGEYKSPNGQNAKATDFERYATFSLWDTYRAEHPLATLLHPKRTIDFIQSMLAHYEETGLLPVWELLGNETDMMMGYHAVPVIADAILKDLGEFDYEQAFNAMKTSAMADQNGLEAYKKMGYVPYEIKSWNVSWTLEYAYDDWCIAQVAKKLGHEKDYAYFMKRSGNYKNHFDPETGFMRAKDSVGKFRLPFDPNAYHPEDYCEANAWHYSFYVPQDVKGLSTLYGGDQGLTEKLQEMFQTDQSVSEKTVWISGYYGQYVHGNEPSHHVPYLFRLLDQPDQTEYWVRKILDEQYTTQADGLCGNEDFGQMSAWYVFSAMGFYPLNPAGGEYVFGSPQIDEATIQLPDGKTFKIKVENQAPENVFIQNIRLNGQVLTRPFLTHQDILAGGKLVFEMKKKE